MIHISSLDLCLNLNVISRFYEKPVSVQVDKKIGYDILQFFDDQLIVYMLTFFLLLFY